MTRCFNCKGTGKAFSYTKGDIICPSCGGIGKISNKRPKISKKK